MHDSSPSYTGVVNNYESFLNFLEMLGYIISEMFGNHCEVVISDLDNPHACILSIYHGQVTGRSVGDPLSTRSYELIERSKGGYNINYKKANKRTKKEIKSSTLVVKAFEHNISFCINYDCDDITALHKSLAKFLSMSSDVYEITDASDLAQQQLQLELNQMGKTIPELNKKDRLLLISKLKDAGVFNLQKSVPYVADELGVSRFTIYNYLNELENNQA